MKLQFRLRTLMIVVTLLAVPLGYVGWQAKIVRERKAVASTVKFIAGDPDDDEVTWLRKVLGDKSYFLVAVDPDATDQFVDRCRRIFPEALVFRRDRSPSSWPLIDKLKIGE